MEKQERPISTFDVYIGGMFIKPVDVEHKTESDNNDHQPEPRGILTEHLKKKTDLVKELRDMEDTAQSTNPEFNQYGVLGRVIKGKFEEFTYVLDTPVVFQLNVSKGTKYVDCYGRENETLNGFKAIVLHNGVWFLAVAYDHENKSSVHYESPGPIIRDVYQTTLNNSGFFTPSSIPPSIIPRRIVVALSGNRGNEQNERTYVLYTGHSISSGLSDLTLEYELATKEARNEDIIAQVLLDIYYNICSDLNEFYSIAHMSNRVSEEHGSILEKYTQACEYVRMYYNTPFWNIIYKIILAARMKKAISIIQIELVDSRLSQLQIMTEASRTATSEDYIGIIGYLKPYLKECIEKDFVLAKDEYEGFSATLTHMNSIAMQQDAIILAVVAIIAGIIGAIIGSVFGR